MGRRVPCWRVGCRVIVRIWHDVYDLGRVVTDWVGLIWGGRKAYDTHVIEPDFQRYVLWTDI